MKALGKGAQKAFGKDNVKVDANYANRLSSQTILDKIDNNPSLRGNEWVKKNINSLLKKCDTPYSDFGNLRTRVKDRVLHPLRGQHRLEILDTFLSHEELYNNKNLQQEKRHFSTLHSLLMNIEDKQQTQNIIDGFNYYITHKELHNNKNIQENLDIILFNKKLSIQNKSKIFDLIANTKNLEETKTSYLNYNNTRLDIFLQCADNVDIDLAFKILLDKKDSNGAILVRVLHPDESISEIKELYLKYKDNTEFDNILPGIIIRYKKDNKKVLDIILNNPDFPKDDIPTFLNWYNDFYKEESKLFLDELCKKDSVPKNELALFTKKCRTSSLQEEKSVALARTLVEKSKLPLDKISEIFEYVNNENAIKMVEDLCLNFESKGLYLEQIIPILKNGNIEVENVAKLNKLLEKNKVLKLTDSELAVLSSLINIIKKKDIYELSKPEKRNLLNVLLQNKKAIEAGEMTSIKEYIPFMPNSTNDYTHLMKSLSNGMNLSFEKLSNEHVKMFNTSILQFEQSLNNIKTKNIGNIKLSISHTDFINQVMNILKNMPENERFKLQEEFGFKIRDNKLIGYPNTNNNVTSTKYNKEYNELKNLVEKYVNSNSVEISNSEELTKSLNNLMKFCPEILNQIDNNNSFSNVIKNIKQVIENNHFKHLSNEDKKILILATMFNKTDKAINSRSDAAFDVYFIAKRFDLSEEGLQKLYSIVELSDAPERFMNTTKDLTRKQIGVQELTGQKRQNEFDLIATKLKNSNTFELAKILYSSEYPNGFTRHFDKILEDRINQIKANDFILPQTPKSTYQNMAISKTIKRGDLNYNIKVINAEEIPDLQVFTHAPDVGYITGGSRDANFANFDFFKLAGDDKVICSCYVTNSQYGPVKQFKNGFCFNVDNNKQYVGYPTDIWSIGKNIPDIVIEYFRDRGVQSAADRGEKFKQRTYISEQLKAILYPEQNNLFSKVKNYVNNYIYKNKPMLTSNDIKYIQRMENIKNKLGNMPFTIENIEKFDIELANAYRTFLNSEQTILVNHEYHNEILVSNPEISGIFTIDLKNIPEEYLKKAQEEDLPIIVFPAEK